MTTINNYDQSSTGINIEFNGVYDTYLAHINFKENFEEMTNGGIRGTNIYFYNPYSQIEVNIDFKIKANKKQAKKCLENHFGRYIDKSWLKWEIIDELDCEIRDILEQYKYEIDTISQELGIDLEYINEIEIISTTGYSQGDYAYVMIDHTQLTKLYGNDSYKEFIRDSVNNFFWNTPVYAEITINEIEYSYSDYMDCEYSFDKEEFIEKVAKEANIDVELLDEIVPSELEYI